MPAPTRCSKTWPAAAPRPSVAGYTHPDVFTLKVPFLHVDDAIVVVDKPSGMLVHRSQGARDPVVVMTVVRDALGRHVHPVHRLDRATSGVMLVALTPESARDLFRQFEAGRISKSYLAVVLGDAPEEGHIDTPLEKHNGALQAALTRYRRLAAGDGCALLEVSPVHGRRHQIRRHLQSVGLPLAGDHAYGDPARNQALSEGVGLERLSLHASRLGLIHPVSRQPLTFSAPLPADLVGPWSRMGLRLDTEGSATLVPDEPGLRSGNGPQE